MPGISLSSTTDSAEQVQAALEQYGYQQTGVEVITSRKVEEPEPAKEEAPQDSSEPAEVEAEKPATEGKTEPESDPEDSQEQEPDRPNKGKGGFQKRIDKLTEKARLAEARNAELERQLADKTAAKPEEKTLEPTKSADPTKPKVGDFTDYEDYVEALTDWKLETREKAKVAAETQRKQAEAQQSNADAWTQREAAVREIHEDYDDVIAAFDETHKLVGPAIPAIQQAIFESDQGPQVSYWLAKHPEEAKRIATLSPLTAVREIGKIEASLSAQPAKVEAAPEPPKPKTSAAPAPIKPVSTKSASAGKDPGEMTPREYEEWRRKGGGR